MKRKGANDIGMANGIWPLGVIGDPELPETDPQGMYTGVPEDPYEQPVQDADDL